MVRVRRQRDNAFGFLKEVTIQRHYMHVILGTIILLCIASYHILLRHEVRNHVHGTRNKAGPSRPMYSL